MICEVRFPVPGPTSSTDLFFISDTSNILLIIFWSIRKFWPKLFFAFITFESLKTALPLSDLKGSIIFYLAFFHLVHGLAKL